MNKKQVISVVKKLTASLLAVGMIVAGIVMYPGRADAAEQYEKVIYVEYQKTDIEKNYWNSDKKIAPVKEGYVFGGWFEQVTEQTDSTEVYEENDGTKIYYNPLTEVDSDAYAKFVPAQVLSVIAQNEEKVNADHIANMKTKIEDKDDTTNITDEDKFYVRVMSSLDSDNYQKVGFDIYLANKKHLGTTETSTIYRGVMLGKEVKYAKDIFGDLSQYVSTWRLTEIDWPYNVSLIIYVRPYWKTMDGTKVNGIAKYIHIEDQYEGYINVPVNLLGGEKVAAGAVTMKYSGDTALELVKFEAGRILPEMKYHYDSTNRTIKMVGNTDQKADKYNEGETIYANLRLKKPTGDITFNVIDEENTFCDWNQKFVDVKKVWDTQYEYKETTTYE